MYRYLSIYKIAIFNLLVSAIFFIWNTVSFKISVNIFDCIANVAFINLALYNYQNFLNNNPERLFIGRKRTIILLTCTVFIIVHLTAIWNHFVSENIFKIDLIWSVFTLAVRMFENDLSELLHRVLKKGRRVAVVGYTDSSLQIASKLKRKGRYFFGHVDFYDDDFTDSLSFEPYIDFAKKNKINEFYLPIKDSHDHSHIHTMANEAEKHCIRVNFIANDKIENPGYRVHYMSGLTVFKKYNEPLILFRNQTVKRTFDVLLSGFILLFILSWLVPLIGLLIKLESKGPIFFRQERSGIDNKSFKCLKFRSMRVNSSSDLLQATKNDSRITKIGAFLRKTSLDELPQFINVFRGDMSIVGPRPHMLQHTEEYNRVINNYMVRLYLKPGVTGWAQAKGYRGETKELELMKKRVEHDIWYMENWSLWLDIKILWLTFTGILKGHENAY